MRLVLQRVSRAEVRVVGEPVGRIGRGLLVLVGMEDGDTEVQVAKAAAKLAGLRVFADAQGLMNLDAGAVGAELLIVSQFTLAGSLEKGRRPSFSRAMDPALASPLIDRLIQDLRQRDLRVSTGRFGAVMEVELVNDGPVTFVIDL